MKAALMTVPRAARVRSDESGPETTAPGADAVGASSGGTSVDMDRIGRSAVAGPARPGPRA